jgi:hypothetical protein
MRRAIRSIWARVEYIGANVENVHFIAYNCMNPCLTRRKSYLKSFAIIAVNLVSANETSGYDSNVRIFPNHRPEPTKVSMSINSPSMPGASV